MGIGSLSIDRRLIDGLVWRNCCCCLLQKLPTWQLPLPPIKKHIVIMTFEYVSVIIDNFFTQTNHCVVSYQLFLSLFYRLCVLFHKMDGRLKRANNKLLHWNLPHYAFKTPSRRYMWNNWKLSIHYGLWLLSVWGGWQIYQGNRAPSSVDLLWVYCILEILISKIKQILTYSVIIFSSKPKH